MSGGKARPAVVVSSAEFHSVERLYIVAAITSNLAASALGHRLDDIKSAGLGVPSLVRPILLTLSPDVMGQRVGRLTAGDMQHVDAMLRRALGLA